MNVIKFYGRTNNPKYWPFSNFYAAPFKDAAGTMWPTTEHFFQAMKFLPGAEIDMWFGEPNKGKIQIRRHILECKTPKLAAQEGRRRDLPLRDDWDKNASVAFPGTLPPDWKVKDMYMYKAIYYKFTQHEDLKQLLLDTGDSEIIEDSPIDYYWGCGKDGSGKNMLGKLLMFLRDELRNG